tara:strand:- start:257 stop:673 length:417 start_codon:yes stop_codon:yes gene_type:complete
MIIQTLTFGSDLNTSLQPEDIVYYAQPGTVPGSGFSTITSMANVTLFGIVVEVYRDGSPANNIPANSITVIYDDTTVSPPSPATTNPFYPGDYIMFSKNKQVNSSSVTGYYANVKFMNYANEPIELFSIGSEVSESSK